MLERERKIAIRLLISRPSDIQSMGYFFFTYPLGHLAPDLTYLVVLPFTHFVEYKDLVVSPRLKVNSPILGIKARISINSFCSLAFRAASAFAAATRAASAFAAAWSKTVILVTVAPKLFDV